MERQSKSDLREAETKLKQKCETEVSMLTNSHRKELSALKKTVDEQAHKIKDLEESAVGAESRESEIKNNTQQEVKSAKQRETEQKGKVLEFERELRDKNRQIRELETEVKRLQQFETSTAVWKGKHEEVVKSLAECQTKGKALEKDLGDERDKTRILGQDLATAQTRISSLNSPSDEAKALAKEIGQMRDQHKQELKACNDDKYQLGLTELNLTNERNNLQGERDRLKADVDGMTKKLDDVQDEINSLKESLADSQQAVQQAKDDCETEKDELKIQKDGEGKRADNLREELTSCRNQRAAAVKDRDTARDQAAKSHNETATAQHLLFDMLLGTTATELTFSSIEDTRNQIELGESGSTQWLQTQLLGDGHPTAGLNALQLWIDVQIGTIRYGNLNALVTTYRVNGYVLAILQDTIVKQMQKPQPWTNEELLTLLRAIEFIHLHCAGTFPVDLSALTSTDLLTAAMLNYVRGLLNSSDRSLGSYLLEDNRETVPTGGLELIPYKKDLIVVDEAAGTVSIIRRGDFATFHKSVPVIECEIRLRNYPSEGEIWVGLLDEDDEDICLRMWDLLTDALMDELDYGNQVWKDAGK